MIHYQVYWKEHLIGNLFIENNQYKYVPNQEVIHKIEKKAFLFREVVEEYDWGSPISFFKQMIENCERFDEKSIFFQNNHYSMEKVTD